MKIRFIPNTDRSLWPLARVGQLMLRRDINTLCGQNVELLTVKLVVRIATTGTLQRVSPLPSPWRHTSAREFVCQCR